MKSATWQWQGNTRVQIRKADDGTWFECRFNAGLFPEDSYLPEWEIVWRALMAEAKSLSHELGLAWDSAFKGVEIEEF